MPTDKESLWFKSDWPVLRQLSVYVKAGQTVGDEALAAGMERDLSEVRGSLKRLHEAGHIKGGTAAMLGGGEFTMSGTTLTEKGLIAAGDWPAQASYDELVSVLQEAIASESDDATRKGLERVLDSVQAVGVAVVSEVLKRVVLGL